MVIIGIDPGLARVGYGIIEASNGNKKLLDCGIIETPKGKLEEKRLLEIFQDLQKLINNWNRPRISTSRLWNYRSFKW